MIEQEVRPAERFQKDETLRKDWERIVANPIFDKATEAAMIGLLYQMPMVASKGDMSQSVEFRMQGARLFLQLLRAMAMIPQEPAKPNPNALPPNLPEPR